MSELALWHEDEQSSRQCRLFVQVVAALAARPLFCSPPSSASRWSGSFITSATHLSHTWDIPHAPRGPVLARCVLPARFPPRTFLDAGPIDSDISRVRCLFSRSGTTRVHVSHDARKHPPLCDPQLLRAPPGDPHLALSGLVCAPPAASDSRPLSLTHGSSCDPHTLPSAHSFQIPSAFLEGNHPLHEFAHIMAISRYIFKTFVCRHAMLRRLSASQLTYKRSVFGNLVLYLVLRLVQVF